MKYPRPVGSPASIAEVHARNVSLIKLAKAEEAAKELMAQYPDLRHHVLFIDTARAHRLLKENKEETIHTLIQASNNLWDSITACMEDKGEL